MNLRRLAGSGGAVLLSLLPTAVMAASPAPRTGVVRTDFGGADQAPAVALQPDGRIVAAGSTFGGDGEDFALARYTANGDLDPSFGRGGMVTTDFRGQDAAQAVAVEPDGRIVAAGTTQGSGLGTGAGDFALARYDADGSLDPTFGTAGLVTTDAGGADAVDAIAVQPDGRIVAVGSTLGPSGGDLALARYEPDGSLDPSFGSGGIVTTDVGGEDQALAVALMPDGRIVVAGSSFGEAGGDFALARYNPDGSLDPAFGSGGVVRTDLGGGDDEAFAVGVFGDGGVLAAGSTLNPGVFPGGGDLALARYGPDGRLDTAFGTGGTLTMDLGGSDRALAVFTRRDGGALVAAATLTLTGGRVALVRLTADGGLDPRLAGTGSVVADFLPSSQPLAAALQPDRRLVVAGATFGPGAGDFALARYRRDGTLDTTFGSPAPPPPVSPPPPA
jgi:uncharacterized delta-60 repeat protein